MLVLPIVYTTSYEVIEGHLLQSFGLCYYS